MCMLPTGYKTQTLALKDIKISHRMPNPLFPFHPSGWKDSLLSL